MVKGTDNIDKVELRGLKKRQTDKAKKIKKENPISLGNYTGMPPTLPFLIDK